MRIRTIIKLATATSVTLFCVALAVSFYFKISATESAEDMDLYVLIPSDAKLIVEANNLIDFIEQTDVLPCSEGIHNAYFSPLFSDIKCGIKKMSEDTPHGLSKQMSRVLVSCHPPNSEVNQVFYFRTGAGDHEVMTRLVEHYLSSNYSMRTVKYKGEEIRIYPLENDRFLSCYVNADFWAISYQKRLIEEVIDARLNHTTLALDPQFKLVRREGTIGSSATIYAYMDSVELGTEKRRVSYSVSVSPWVQYDLNLHEDLIYLSSVSHLPDSCNGFMGFLCNQGMIDGLDNRRLPASTLYFVSASVENINPVFQFVTQADMDEYNERSSIEAVKQITRPEMIVCAFATDSTYEDVHTVLSFPLSVEQTEVVSTLLNLHNSIPMDLRAQSFGEREKFTFTTSHPCYLLPQAVWIDELVDSPSVSTVAFATIHRGHLILSADVQSLKSYIDAVSDEHFFGEASKFSTVLSTLSQQYSYLFSIDMEHALSLHECRAQYVPDLFFSYGEFFRHFIISIQIQSDGDGIYPHIILSYKD